MQKAVIYFFIFIILTILIVKLFIKDAEKKQRLVDRKLRKEKLIEKYGDEELVDKLINSCIWVGQTMEQLTDSLGSPHSIDTKVLKTKTKEIWKYQHRGGNRYGLRITLEEQEVVGFDHKT